MFGDLRDPMTEQEIEADIQQREQEDRRERAVHPITLQKFGASIVVTDRALEPRWLQRHAAWIETIKHNEQQKLLRVLLNRRAP